MSIVHTFPIGKTLTAVIDRPLGSRHPEWGFEYKLNYGFIANMPAKDTEDQDVYVMGVDEPLQSFTGDCIAVILRADDMEDKLVLAPVGMTRVRMPAANRSLRRWHFRNNSLEAV